MMEERGGQGGRVGEEEGWGRVVGRRERWEEGEREGSMVAEGLAFKSIAPASALN